MPSSKNLVVLAGMPLVWADVADSTVQMLDVVPMHELAGPVSGLIEIFEPMSRKLRPVLGGSECRFCKSVVVTHTRPGVRGFDPQPVEHCQDGGRFERRAVIAVQDGLGLIGGDALGQRGPLHDARSMVGIIGFMHLPAHDLAAVNVENQVQKKPTTSDLGGQVGQESRPRGSHPQPLAERYVNVSAHTAPVKQTHLSSPRASEQTILGCASYTVQRTPWRQSSCASVT